MEGVDVLLVLMKTVIWLLSLLVLAVTVLPLFNSHQWWIRMWDFPRLHILVVAVALAVLAFLTWRSGALILLLILAASALNQARMIFPFTPLAQVEIELGNFSGGAEISILSANVLMENKEHDQLAALIEEEDPDVLFLMETDSKWVEGLEHTLSGFDTVLTHPLDNHYGFIFATNLEAPSAETIFLSDDNTPTLLAELKAPDGRGFNFIGMHPRPPVPGNDTEERDVQIRRAATLTKNSALPVISMGDFNDVAWSWTAKRFKHHGKYRDPRVGRGMLPSFDAEHPILRFPIDQLYVTEGVDLISFERKRAVGSDHFPMGAVVAISGGSEK
ncbi:endonuclease/exonuclease/phosphatase family protein [Leisingera sp. HS039]|nr:endonuclease/exonuclease/phosphatase family protein [Leisingera sp. HS039]QBR38353.1 endonuclease/exonuclease/phosphatase family protein [Leisingera sp. NJS201]